MNLVTEIARTSETLSEPSPNQDFWKDSIFESFDDTISKISLSFSTKDDPIIKSTNDGLR